MKLRLEAEPAELRDKGTEMVKSLAEQVRPFNPALAKSLEKSLREASVDLHWQVLRDLHGRLREAYGDQLKSMNAEIAEVLGQAVDEDGEKSLEKAGKKKAPPKGGPYIGPRGGLWADPKHTIHWDPAKHGKVKAEVRHKVEHAKEHDKGERYGDEKATLVCQTIGDGLYELQRLNSRERDATGFSSHDMERWESVRGSLHKMRKLLYKYRRQILEQNPHDYYAAGISAHDPKYGNAPQDPMPVVWGIHPTFGSLNVKVDAYIKDRAVWEEVHAYHKGLGMFPARGVYVLKEWDDFDFDAYKKGLVEIIPDAIFPDTPPRGKTPKERAAEEKAALEAAVKSESPVDAVWRGLADGTYKKAVGAKVNPDKGTIEFRFPKGKLSKIFSNKAGYLTALTWWDSTTQPWGVHVFDIDTAEAALRYIKEVDPEMTIVTEGFDEARAKEDARQAQLRQPIPEVAAKLNPEFKAFPYQNEGIRFLLDKDGNAMLGDEMGLGKTFQVLAYAAVTGKKTVVICPKTVRRTWVEEADQFFPTHFVGKELNSKALLKEKRKLAKEKKAQEAADKEAGKPYDPLASFFEKSDEQIIAERLGLADANLATINYESVAKFTPYLAAAGFEVMVMDESHRMKNPGAKRTKAIQQLGESTPHKILLSGTAVKNKRDDLITQIEMVRPGKYGYRTVRGEWGDYQRNVIKDRTTGQLWSEMRDFYLARQKDIVLKDLPPKTLQLLPHKAPGAPDLPTDHEKLVNNERWFTRASAIEKGKTPEEADVIADEAVEALRERIQELQMKASEGSESAAGLLEGMLQYGIGDYSRIKTALAQAKAPMTADFVNEILDSSDSNVLVFTNSKGAARELTKRFNEREDGLAELHFGETGDEARERIKRKFKPSTRDENEKARVLVGTMDTLQEGATLTSVDKVVFNDLPWTAMEFRQAEARAHRPGQDKPVNVYWVTAEGNDFDTAISSLLKYKIELTKKQNEGRVLTEEENRWLNTDVSVESVLAELRGEKPNAALVQAIQATVTDEGKAVSTEVHEPEAKPPDVGQRQADRRAQTREWFAGELPRFITDAYERWRSGTGMSKEPSLTVAWLKDYYKQAALPEHAKMLDDRELSDAIRSTLEKLYKQGRLDRSYAAGDRGGQAFAYEPPGTTNAPEVTTEKPTGPTVKVPQWAVTTFESRVAEFATDPEGHGLDDEERAAYQELHRHFDQKSGKFTLPGDKATAGRIARLLTDLSNLEDEMASEKDRDPEARAMARHASTGLGELSRKVLAHDDLRRRKETVRPFFHKTNEIAATYLDEVPDELAKRVKQLHRKEREEPVEGGGWSGVKISPKEATFLRGWFRDQRKAGNDAVTIREDTFNHDSRAGGVTLRPRKTADDSYWELSYTSSIRPVTDVIEAQYGGRREGESSTDFMARVEAGPPAEPAEKEPRKRQRKQLKRTPVKAKEEKGEHLDLFEMFKSLVASGEISEEDGEAFIKAMTGGGPYIGPKGGKWADPEHTIPYDPNAGKMRHRLPVNEQRKARLYHNEQNNTWTRTHTPGEHQRGAHEMSGDEFKQKWSGSEDKPARDLKEKPEKLHARSTLHAIYHGEKVSKKVAKEHGFEHAVHSKKSSGKRMAGGKDWWKRYGWKEDPGWDGQWVDTTQNDPARYEKEGVQRASKHMQRLAEMRKSGNLPGSVIDAIALFAITSKRTSAKVQERVWPQVEQWLTRPEGERKLEELTQIMRPLGVQNARTEEFRKTKASRAIIEEGIKKFPDHGPELRDWLREHPGFKEHGGGGLANAKISFCLELLGYSNVGCIDARVLQHLTGAKGDAATKLASKIAADGDLYREFEGALGRSASYKQDDPEELRLGMAQWRMWDAEGGSDTDHGVLWQTIAKVTGIEAFAKAMTGGISLVDFADILSKAQAKKQPPQAPPKPPPIDGGDDYDHDGQDHHDVAQIVSAGVLQSFGKHGPAAPVHYDAVPVISGLAAMDAEGAQDDTHWAAPEAEPESAKEGAA